MLTLAFLALAVGAPAEIDVTPGRGVSINSVDGRSGITFSPRMQARVALLQDGDWQGQFTIRRARLDVKAFALSGNIRLRMQLAFSPEDVDLRPDGSFRQPFLDAYLEVRLIDTVDMRLGLMKVPFNHERIMSSARFRFVDRSIIDNEFTFDRDYGFVWKSGRAAPKWFAFYAGIFTGQGFDGYQFDRLAPLYMVRGVLNFGDIKTRDEWSHGERGLSLGAAYAFADDAHKDQVTLGRIRDLDEQRDVHSATFNVLAKAYNVALAVEGNLRHAGPGNGGHRDAAGYRVELGYDENQWSAAVRWADLRPLAGSELAALSELGFAVASILGDHWAKLSADFTHRFNPLLGGQTEQLARLQLEFRL